MKDPRQAYLDMRKRARDGETVYDGDRFTVTLSQEVQNRVQDLAGTWRVPRAEMVRYLVAAGLELVESMPLPKEDQETEGDNEDATPDP